MTCKHCGSPLDEGTLFCSECGAKLELPAQEPIVPAEPEIAGPTPEAPMVDEAAIEEPVTVEPAAPETTGPEDELQPPVTASQAVCPQCGTPLEEGCAFCPECGAKCAAPVAPVAAAAPVCSVCGTAIEEGHSFCVNCGTPCQGALQHSQQRSLQQSSLQAQQPVQQAQQAAPPPPAFIPQSPAVQPEPVSETPPKQKKQKKEKPEKIQKTRRTKRIPPAGVRVLLRICSLLLCLVLCGTVLATAVVLDLRQLTSKDSVEKVVTSMFTGNVEVQDTPLSAAVVGHSASIKGKNLDTLLEWLYDFLKERFGDEMTITLEQMKDFVNRSNVKDKLTDKLISYVDDFLNGTNNTQITEEEIIQVIEENEELIEEIFGEDVEVVDIEEVQEEVLDFVEENDLNTVIREEVFEQIEQQPLMGDDYTVKDLLADFRSITSDTMLIALIAINLALIIVLFFTNWMRLHATLNWAGTSLTIIGGLLSLPTLLLQLLPNLVGDLFSASLGSGQADLISTLVGLVVALIAPVHYIILLLGLAMLIASIVIRIIAKVSAE